jgi:hypothetical protein
MNYFRRILQADLGRLFRTCFRFNLRVLLLTLIVAATLTKVFLVPKPHQSGSGALVFDSFHRKVPQKENPNVRVRRPPDTSRGARHGRWKIQTASRRVLATGHFEMGQASGNWQHYDVHGNRLAAGECVDGQLNNQWTTWNADGTILATANFADRRELYGTPVLPRNSLVSNSVRHGKVSWYDENQKEHSREYQRGLPVNQVPVATIDASRSSNLEALRQQVRGPRMAPAIRAVRQLGQHGTAGAAVLAELLSEVDERRQLYVLMRIKEMESVASNALPSVMRIADQPDHPYREDAKSVLLSIDPAARPERLKRFFEEHLAANIADASDLASLVLEHVDTIDIDMKPTLSDKRTSMRRLACAILIHAAKTAATMREPEGASKPLGGATIADDPMDLGYPALGWTVDDYTPSQVYPSDDVPFADLAASSDFRNTFVPAIVHSLMTLRHDADEAIRNAAECALTRLAAED